MNRTSPPSLGASFDPSRLPVETPYTFYGQVRQEEPITFCPALDAYLVSRYDDIRTILLRPDIFSSKDVFGAGVHRYPQTIAELQKGYPFETAVVSHDGARHTRLRELVQKALSSAQVRTLEPSIRQIATRLVDRFIDDGQAEIISQFAAPLPLEVIFTILGVPREDMGVVKKQSEDLFKLLVLPLPLEEQLRCARQQVALQHYYARLIQEKRQKPADDLISHLIRNGATGEKPLTDTDFVNLLTGLVIAGHETTTHLIGSGLVLLLEEETRWQALCEHPEQIPQAIEEILRFRGPIQGFMRTATREVTVGGITMPEGTKCCLLYASGNQDECRFSHASDFEMQRRPNPHLAFGHGIHSCLGAPLARLEGRIAFEVLTQRFPLLRLLPDQQYVYTPNMTFYGHQHVYIQW